MPEKPAHPASSKVLTNAIPDLKQDTLEKSRARVQKLLKEWRESEARRKARAQEKQEKQRQKAQQRKKRAQQKAQKAQWKKYNKSERGRERFRRYRRSLHGKTQCRRVYESRREWLDQVMGQRGCMICHEKNPLTLRLRVRPRQRVPFSPESKNLSRSKLGWQEVIRHCDVVCLNCLLKKEPHRKSGRPRKVREMVREVAEISREAIVNDGKNVHGGLLRPNICKTCGAEFKPNKSGPRKREFCSDSCRLLYWAGKRLLEAARAGKADGLQGIVAEFAEVNQ
jgi:hypothetical protein